MKKKVLIVRVQVLQYLYLCLSFINVFTRCLLLYYIACVIKNKKVEILTKRNKRKSIRKFI